MAHLVPPVPKSQPRTIPSSYRDRGDGARLLLLPDTTHTKATMSVRPGLIAATRAGVPSKALRAQWIRCSSNDAASSSAPKRASATATVQDADREIKERQRMLRRLPPGFDTAGAYAPIVFGELPLAAVKLTTQSPLLTRHGSSRTCSSTSRSMFGSV